MDEIVDNPWWTDRTRRELREIRLGEPGATERILSQAHALAPETLVAIIRRLPPETLAPDSPVLNACIAHLLVPHHEAAATSPAVELLVRVTAAARRAFGPLSRDELEEFHFGFVAQHLRKQVLSRADNKILEERFWFRVRSRLYRFINAEQRRRYAASVLASSYKQNRTDVETTVTTEAFVEQFRREIGLWLPSDLARTVELWLDGYPISSSNPEIESIAGELEITREAVSKRLRRAGTILSGALDRPVVLLRRPRKHRPGAAGAGGTPEQQEVE